MLSRMSVAVLAIVAPCVFAGASANAQSSCPKPRMPQFRGPQGNRPAPQQRQVRWQNGNTQNGNTQNGNTQNGNTQNGNTQNGNNNGNGGPTAGQPSGDVKTVSLKLHNDLRDLTSNFKLGHLAWNETLAAGAQQRAEHYDQQGQLDHHVGWQSTGDGTMAEVLAGRGTSGDVNGLIKLFINEGPGGGHFDIMVSPNYSQVGCGEKNGMLACHYK